MAVAAKLVLVVGLLAGQAPVCKVAAARSLTRTHTARLAPAPTCKKGCCEAAARLPAPRPPARDHTPPAKPQCPADCLSPLCSAPPVVSEPSCVVAYDGGASEELPLASCPSPGAVYHSPLDRPPRA